MPARTAVYDPSAAWSQAKGRGEAKTHSKKQISGSGNELARREEFCHASSRNAQAPLIWVRENKDMGERSGAREKDSTRGGRGAVLTEADPERSLLCSLLFCSFADPSSPAAALSNKKQHHVGHGWSWVALPWLPKLRCTCAYSTEAFVQRKV